MRIAAVAAVALLAFPALPSSAEEPAASGQPPAASRQEPGAPEQPGASEQAGALPQENAAYAPSSRTSGPAPAARAGAEELRLGIFVKTGTLAGARATAAVRGEHRGVTSAIERSSRALRASPDRRASIGLRLEF